MGDQQAPNELWVGAQVYCRDGEALGHVKAIREAHFKVNAPLQPDYWLRRAIVARVTAEGVMLAVAKDHLSAAQVGDPDLDAGPAPPSAPPTVPADYAPATTLPNYVPAAASDQRGPPSTGGSS